MVGIDDLRLFRSESMPDEWIKFDPKHPRLGWKYPYQGRWYTADLNFARDWMGGGNIIKELNIKSPIPLSKELQNYPRYWSDGTFLPQYKSKTITELLDDVKTLKKWVPKEGMGSGLDKLKAPFLGDPLITKFDEYMKRETKTSHPFQFKNFISLVPPKEIADKGSVNVYESIMKNLRKPKYSPFLISRYGQSWLKNIMELPKKIKYLNQLKQANVPMHSGINWQPAARVGLNAVNLAGKTLNAAVIGQVLADVYAGTNFMGSAVDQINRLGGLRKNVDTGRLEQNPFHGARIGAQDAQARRGVSTGGIVSIVV